VGTCRFAGLSAGALLLTSVPASFTASAAPRMTIQPRLTVIHDSNIARSSKEAAELRGLKLSDVRFSPGVNFNAEVPLGRQTLYLKSDVGYDFHARNKQLNASRLFVEGGTRFLLSRCAGTMFGVYSRRRSDISDLLDLGPANNIESTRSLTFDGRCGGPVGLVPGVRLSRGWTDNSQPVRQISDARSWSARGSLIYARPSLGELSLVADVRHVDYPERPAAPAISDGYKVTSFGGRFQRAIGSRMRASVELLRTSVDAGTGEGKFNGATASADINYRLSDVSQFQLTASRDVQPASLGSGDFVLASVYAARADYGISPRLTARAAAGLDRRRTKGVPALPIDPLTSERRYYGSAAISYKWAERGFADLELRREVRRANPSVFDYSSTRIMMTLRSAFGARG